MFYVTSKDKIISVVIALSTVIVLFLLASALKVEKTNSIETSTNSIKKSITELNTEIEDNDVYNSIIQNKN